MGSREGAFVGSRLGTFEGSKDGAIVGKPVGFLDGTGVVGTGDGADDAAASQIANWS